MLLNYTKAINGWRSYQNDFIDNIIMNVLVEEIVSTDKLGIYFFHHHTFTFPKIRFNPKIHYKDFLKVVFCIKC